MEPIAIIGIGCRFPAAPDLRSLWDLLLDGREALEPPPTGRYLHLSQSAATLADPWQRLSSLPGGFLDGIDLFDPAAFDISPREARVIDPQQRLLLETTWEAIEDAGQDMRRLAGASVGVYVGVWGSDYQARLFRSSPHIDIAMTTGGGRYAAAGRLSYAFDFQGPSLTIDTACSSSLVAVHMACQALRAGECDLAFAGGANVILDSAVTLGYLSAGALSPDGRCKFGDASADGYVRSEGAGIVLLKPLGRALADNDPIHGVIRGSAVTHNGQTGGSLLAPGEVGQLRLLRQALAAAGIGPGDLDYIEAHGTGTRVGDRMELGALGKLLAEGRAASSPPCLIGSIKTNIGHTESAAGIAGLIKAILCLKHREVPASLHFRQPNPEIAWENLPLRIVTERTPLRSGGRPVLAGINSFGITGTFAHVILEEAVGYGSHGHASNNGHATPSSVPVIPTSATKTASRQPVLLAVSARSRPALEQLARAFARQIRCAPDELSSMAFSAALRRTHHELRLAVFGREAQALTDNLEAFARNEMDACCCVPPDQPLGAARIGWVFSGQGPQWPGMGRQLFDTEPVFREMIERLEPLIETQTGWSLLAELSARGATSKLSVTSVAQPAIFAVQVGLVALLESWGIQPSMIVGHSVGEAAAAYAAGLLSLEDAVRVICQRARIVEQASGLGKMAAVELTVDEALELISSLGNRLSLAAVNGPRSLTISGAVEPLHEFCQSVTTRGRFCRVLDVNYPFHSALLDPLLEEMAVIGQGITVRTPHTPLYSTVHGRLATVVDFGPAYWPRNLRETVQFAPAIESMMADGCNLFVEISPHPVLSYSIKQLLNSHGAPGYVVETLRRESDESVDMRKAAGELYVHGYDPDWSALVAPDATPVSLPTYPWQRESYWIDEQIRPSAPGDFKADGVAPFDPLLRRSLRVMAGADACHWESDISLEEFPWLADHRVQGRAVYPAAAYLLPALKAAGYLQPGSALKDVELHEAAFIPPVAALSMQFSFQRADDGDYSLAIHAGDATRPELARKHVTGRVLPATAASVSNVLRPDTFAENGTPAQSREAVYAAMRRGRLEYGTAFQGIELLKHGHGEALARLTVPSAIQADVAAHGIHPATFDACVQTLVALTPDWFESDELWMPRAVSELALRRLPGPGEPLWAWAKVVKSCEPTASEMLGDVFLLDGSGEILLEARGLSLHRVSRSVDSSTWLHEVRWQPQPLPSAPQDSDVTCFMPPLPAVEARMTAVEPIRAEHQQVRVALTNLNQIAGVSVQQAFSELGFAFTPGRRVTLDEVVAETGIVPQHRRLLKRLLEILAEDGILVAEGTDWRVKREPAAANLAALLQAAGTVDSDFAPLWQIFGRASLNLSAALAGRIDAVELLFDGDGTTALEKLYSDAVFWREPTRRLQQAVTAIVERMSQDRTLRVLEIGAGTGGLTSHILPLLPAARTEYDFTDLSSYFLTRAREKFSSYPFLTGKIFDVEQEPLPQGFATGGYDLILAANCLHATRSVRQSLGSVQQLLAPGGYLLLLEETAAERWTDLIFGLTDGWWRFDEDDLRADHPLLSPQTWLRVLREQGFADATVVGGNAQDVYRAAVVVARQPESHVGGSVTAGRGHWILLADSSGIAHQLADRLTELGQNCRVVDSIVGEPDIAAGNSLAEWLTEHQTADRTIVDLRALDAALADSDDAVSLETIQHRAVSGFLGAVLNAVDCDSARPPRFVLVTRGSQATGLEQTRLALAQAPVWTIARVAGLEHPRLPILRIDLDSAPVEGQIAAIVVELLQGDGEPEIAIRQCRRLVPRLQRLDTASGDRRCLSAGEPFAIQIVDRGSLDGVEAQAASRQHPAAGEVQIRISAAGVNFRDVLNVLGAVDRVPLGLECSGSVTAVGAEVSDFVVGDQVMAAGFGSWTTYFNTPEALVVAKPARLGHEQAAALPLAYLTAHYALRHMIQIRAGQRVLIHSAAGGVGLAAMHIALAAGAEVYGTAGSPAKREYLRSLGAAHIFDSRTHDFADQISAVCGRGIDVVLNCLSGQFIPKSVDLLADCGCFVEIGKRDIWSSQQVAERRPDVKYRVIELAEVMRRTPATLQPMLRQLAREVDDGELPALPIRAFPMSQVVPALRFMQQGLHTGKIVLRAPGSLSAAPADAPYDFTTGSWLITGAFGGLGLALAERLAERGARELIMVGRRAPQGAAQATIERLAAIGVRVLAETCDVANEADLATLLDRTSRELSPLRGVFHLAGALDDAPLAQLDWQRFATVYRPKVLGAWNLHRLTRDKQLDCFVLFSSWTALLGSPGQANHASANAFLDALAHDRRAQGLPAQTINWGGWRDVGSAARPERLAHLDRQGVGNFSPGEALDALGRVMSTDAIQIGISPFAAERWRASSPTQWASCFTAGLKTEVSARAEEAQTTPELPLRDALQQTLSGPARRQMLERCIQRHLSRVLRLPAAKFDLRKSFKGLGLDSLTSLELRNQLEVEAGLKLPASLVYNHATVATLATELAAQMGISLEAAVVTVDSVQLPGAAGADELSDLLSALLEQMPAEEALRLLVADSSQGGAP